MKLHLLAMTALVLAGVPLAQAQEESTPEPTAPEQSASPAEDTSVSVSTQKSSPAAKAPTPTATPSKSSSPAAKSSSTPAPSRASASPAATVAPRKSSVEATLKDFENKWEASVRAHDVSVAQGLLADDFIGVTSKGKVVNKAGLLNEIKKDKDNYTSAANSKLEVRVFGGQCAVVTGVATEVGKDKDGKDFNRSFRWIDTWLERNGRWQCVASQAMALPK